MELTRRSLLCVCDRLATMSAPPPPPSSPASPPYEPSQPSHSSAKDAEFNDYSLNHYREEVKYWKKVICRKIECETCGRIVDHWIVVEFGDSNQNVRSFYCSDLCESEDGYCRVKWCFDRRAVVWCPESPSAWVPAKWGPVQHEEYDPQSPNTPAPHSAGEGEGVSPIGCFTPVQLSDDEAVQ